MTFPQIISSPRIVLSALLMLLALLFASPVSAQLPRADGANNIRTSLIAETSAPAPGSDVMLAFVMSPDKGWHGYWENPGDAGIGMTLDWTLPEGVTAGPLRFPVPEPLMISGIMNYVYEGEHAPLVSLSIANTIAPGTRLPIRVRADWLACTDEVCVPESGSFSITLVAGNGAIAADRGQRFDGFRQRLPAPLGAEGTFSVRKDRFRIAIPLPSSASISNPYFFPLTDGVIDYSAPQKVFRDGDRLTIETTAKADGPDEIAGLLKIGPHLGLTLTAKRGKVKAGGRPVGATSGGSGNGGEQASILIMLSALGGAILGGLLLNIMPCVFPILSLKAISLSRAGGDEASARREALAYGAGVILVCVALGALLLALRAAGEEIGWAFQLQDPRIVLFLLLLVTAIALNLAGLFELPSLGGGERLASRGGTGGAFWTGALAAFVATPCTAPFMAAALGTALILPSAAALLVFAGLGLGLALPFLLIGLIPALRNRMPRPGPWMETFRRIMAVPMFLTALALAWLLGQQTGNGGLVWGLGAALLAGLLLWWLGLRQARGGSALALIALPVLALAIAAPALLPMEAGQAKADLAKRGKPDGVLPAEVFSEARLAELRQQGRPVFAYFTADWCITCKANEAAAINRTETATAFASANVAVLEGDWTLRDAEISRFLAAQGRSGVPLYLYYPADGDAQVLPQILTVSTLTALVS
ncbi:MAG: protein-disulfide reductase DsbD family protein [Blastomonas sp.]